MQWSIKATLLVAAVTTAAGSPVMLMDTVTAVEVSESSAPLLPVPSAGTDTPAEVAAPVDPPSEDCFILGSKTFSIPFTVDAVGVQPTEVHLFVARGPAAKWSLLERKRPDATTHQFQFTAQQDGEYWFATRTFDSSGRPHPSGAIEPQLKVYVDTTKPQVSLSVDAGGDGVVNAKIAIHDATPLKNIQLRYATDTVGQWQETDVSQLSENGTLRLVTDTEWKQISVHCVVTDTAGNQTATHQLVKRPRVAASDIHRYASSTPESNSQAAGGDSGLQIQPAPYRTDYTNRLRADTVSNPVIQLDRHRNPPSPPPGVATAYGYANRATAPSLRGAAPVAPSTSNGLPMPFSPAPTQLRAMPSAAPTTNPFFAGQFAQPQTPPVSTLPSPGANQVNPTAPPAVEEIPVPPPTAESAPNGFDLNAPQQSGNSGTPAPRPRTPTEAMRPIGEASAADQHQPRETIPTPTPDSTTMPLPRSESESGVAETNRVRANRVEPSMDDLQQAMNLAPRRYSDSFRFSLDYELEAVGSLGVEAIELYGTVDSGKTWQLWGRDPDRSSPFDIETKEEGVFGFRIVVVGQNGLASPRPLSGESPDIAVVVDTTAPTVRITGAQYGEGDRIGALVIRYECEDRNLKQRPVALSFSDSVEGPWTTIAAGLRNDGDYVWPADPKLPRKLHLRIDVTDAAGNVGTYVLQEPIDAQGLAPRARIRGFQSLSGGLETPASDQAGDDQTAKRSWSIFQ